MSTALFSSARPTRANLSPNWSATEMELGRGIIIVYFPAPLARVTVIRPNKRDPFPKSQRKVPRESAHFTQTLTPFFCLWNETWGTCLFLSLHMSFSSLSSSITTASLDSHGLPGGPSKVQYFCLLPQGGYFQFLSKGLRSWKSYRALHYTDQYINLPQLDYLRTTL